MVDAHDCRAAEHAENPLMTPPCDCVRCAPAHSAADDTSRTTIWIPANGRPVRHEVHNLDLGAFGHELLG